jgi:putative SOS response-associated peptidase YedK
MCGRFAQFSDNIPPRFRPKRNSGELWFSFNYAPSQKIKAVLNTPEGPELRLIRWGLITSWTEKLGRDLINVRRETLAEKHTFETMLKNGRCLIFADGFFEWRKTGRKKQPWFIRLKQGHPMAFAGLWHTHTDAKKGVVETCAIITTTPNALMLPIHDRMPAILPEGAWDAWLDTDRFDKASLLSLLEPYPAEDMECWPVSPRVNSPDQNDEELIRRTKEDLPDEEPGLF